MASKQEDFCILDNASNELDLLIHKSLLILKDRPILNVGDNTNQAF